MKPSLEPMHEFTPFIGGRTGNTWQSRRALQPEADLAWGTPPASSPSAKRLVPRRGRGVAVPQHIAGVNGGRLSYCKHFRRFPFFPSSKRSAERRRP